MFLNYLKKVINYLRPQIETNDTNLWGDPEPQSRDASNEASLIPFGWRVADLQPKYTPNSPKNANITQLRP
jgi:hypothetical protein